MMKSPVVIGAMGGSGTRVIARLVEGAGVFIGTNRNRAEDAREFVEFYDRWINRYLGREVLPLSQAEQAAMAREFQDCVARHCATIPAPDLDWGWKEPRSIYLVPFFRKRFPSLKFIHVIRDGRDMALSKNQNQLRKHGEAVLDPASDSLPALVRSAILWSRINRAAADYGESVLGDRYLRVRFEDVCQDPKGATERIYAFLERSGADVSAALEVVSPPDSIGRWRVCPDAELIQATEIHARRALVRFGYIG
jgi:sulfotransferase family protein